MHSYTVELRVRGVGLNPSEVTSMTGISPTFTQKPGESPNPKGTAFGTWGYGSKPSSSKQEWDSLEAALEANLRDLAPARQVLIDLKSRYEVFWWCGCFFSGLSGGPSFSPQLLRELSDFEIELIFDCYSSDGE